MSFFHRIRRIFGGRSSGGHGDAHAHGGGEDHGPGSPGCQEAMSLLYDYLDGELEGVSLERVKAHFEACRMCYPHLRFEEAFRAAIQRAGRGEKAPADLKAHLLELLESTSAES
ncbi:MAG: zf-HC2 domain-containing protein [Gemmatimonadetes bacterium]|nr:zf-HC2 domain-containing protein [Gemmatimonadota bacterium]